MNHANSMSLTICSSLVDEEPSKEEVCFVSGIWVDTRLSSQHGDPLGLMIILRYDIESSFARV
jgi:hypothetical protein